MAFFYELCDLGGNGFRRYATAFAVQFCPFAVLVELNPVAVDKHDIVARVQESFLHFGECHLSVGKFCLMKVCALAGSLSKVMGLSLSACATCKVNTLSSKNNNFFIMFIF